MTIRTLLATATMCCLVALTGCATKEATKIDLAPPTTSLAAKTTTTTAAPAPTINENTAGGTTTDSVIVAESTPKTGDGAEQSEDASAKTGLEAIYFDFDAYLLSIGARDTLSRNARWLDENRLARVIVEGHADERGSDDYNLALAEKRAFAVRRYIENLGIDPDRMETISYGEDKPAVIGHDEAAWSKNRRVEFVIVK